MQIKQMTFADFPCSCWSGGTTTELLLLPENGSYAERRFDLRISSATIDDERSVFSALDAYHRILLTLTGPIDLHRESGEIVRLQPLEPFAFEGSEHIESVGRCRDFNVIYNDRYRPGVQVLGAAGVREAELQLAAGDQLFVLAPQGGSMQLAGQSFQLAPLDVLSGTAEIAQKLTVTTTKQPLIVVRVSSQVPSRVSSQVSSQSEQE